MANKNEAMLYLHIPYCVVKCPYCEFNSYSLTSTNNKHSFDEERYTAALCHELEVACRNERWSSFELRTIFFGGGTPSLFSPKSIERVINTSLKLLSAKCEIEITLEANPGTIQEPVDREKIKGYQLAGINRISLGAQSFIAEKLTKLGRIHKVDDTKNAVENILASGISNFNLDLIFGVNGDTVESWSKEIATAVSLAPKHISAYALTLEPGTPFYRQAAQGHSMAVDDELGATLYETTMEELGNAGYQQYELSNYSLENFECQHNRGYWQGLSYLGLGAGAHSYLAAEEATAENFGQRWSDTPAPLRYIEEIELSGEAKQKRETIGAKEAHNEAFYLALRTREGISEADYQQRTGSLFSEKIKESIEFLIREDLLSQQENSRLVLSAKGKLVANSILEEFILS